MSAVASVSWFAEIGLADRPDVGGKGGSLGELERAGIPVPPGFVVRTGAFEQMLEQLERTGPLRKQVEALDPDDYHAIHVCSDALRARFEQTPLPADVRGDIEAAYAQLWGDGATRPVAVRSSATTEDADDASFAGLQDTYLWITSRERMLAAVRSCWASLYSVESISYRLRRGIAEQAVAMAVVVQRMVDARCSGVMFTRSPITGDRSVIAIEGAWGLGSAVVGGEVTPDRWVVNKITGEIAARDVSDKTVQHVPAAEGGVAAVAVPEELRRTPCLSDEQLKALRQVARQVERHYGRAQDIEWAVDRHDDRILLLQSRAETVWSARDAESKARPEATSHDHVMTIFGGRR